MMILSLLLQVVPSLGCRLFIHPVIRWALAMPGTVSRFTQDHLLIRRPPPYGTFIYNNKVSSHNSSINCNCSNKVFCSSGLILRSQPRRCGSFIRNKCGERKLT